MKPGETINMSSGFDPIVNESFLYDGHVALMSFDEITVVNHPQTICCYEKSYVQLPMPIWNTAY